MVISKGYFCFPFRYYVLLLTAASTAFMFASRCVINVAILAMVKEDSNSTEQDISKSSTLIVNWNQEQQAIIIGSYHYFYTILQISTGVLADKFDVVKLTTLSHFFSTLTIFAFPLAASSSYTLSVILRIGQGLFHAPVFPCCYVIFENWFTPQEKAFAIGIMTFSYNFGTAVVMPVTAWLCENGFSGGWPSAFYSMGIVNLIYIILFYLTITSSPDKNKLISDNEKEFICKHIQKKQKRKASIPWKSMFTSIPLWSATIARGILSTAYNVVNSRIPLYLETILGYPLQSNGFINSAFYLLDACGQIISGPLSQFIASKGYLSLDKTRKVFESIALLGPAFFLISIPFLSGNAQIIILGLTLTMFTMGFSSGGDVPMIPEIAPGIVGTVFGFSNTLSCAAGFISPMAISYILDDQIYSINKWNIVFFLFGGLQIIGAIQFFLFATSKPQSWALIETFNNNVKKDIEMNYKSVTPTVISIN